MKLQLACALAHEPSLLILDEATAGLDPIAREGLLDSLREFMAHDGRGILLSSHITSDLEKIADRIVCIDAGRIVFDMDKDAICDHAGIARCRKAEFRMLADGGFLDEGVVRFVERKTEVDVLVEDRLLFSSRFPEIVCERCSLDEWMQLFLKGERS